VSDVEREIQSHLELCVEELVGKGWAPDEAWVEARRRFGKEDRIRLACEAVECGHRRRVRRTQMVESTLQDLRFGLRTLLKSPGFFLMAILILALGIGANTTVFSLVHGVLLKPLPFDRPEELVWVAERSQSGSANWVTWPNFKDWQAEARSFRGLAAFNESSATVLGGDRPVFTTVATVSRDFWTVFPVTPLAGRLTVPEDHVEGASPVVVVTEGLAQQVLGGETAVGKGIEVSGSWHEVVGVLPEDLDFPKGTQVWIPAELTSKSQSRTSHNWKVVGRLHPGLTAADADLELDPLTVRLVAATLQEEGPEYVATGTIVTSLQEYLVGDTRRPLFLLLGAAAFVLLVACTNLASTFLARGTSRTRELALRSALGASRTRLVRQLLSEAWLLAALGGGAGVLISVAALRWIRATGAESIPRIEDVALDGRVLIFTLVVTLMTALAFGLLPALRARENDQAGTLRSEGRGSEGYKGRVWGTLVSVEVAMALVLLTGSGLLIRSFNAILQEEPGFDGKDAVLTGVALSGIKYPDLDDHRLFWDGMLARAEAIPGVARAGLATVIPASGFVANGRVELDGDPAKTGDADYIVASSGLFETLGIPVLRGRVFDATDDPNAPHRIVVSESFAETYWPGEDPIGKQVSGGGMDDLWSANPPVFGTVVGVVADVRYRDLTRAGRPAVYWNYRQRPYRIRWGANLVVKSATGDPAAVAGSLRQALQEMDPDVAPRIQYLRDVVSDSLGQRRFSLLVMSAFAVVGLLLAAIGIFGVVSYAVAQRTREMGIRLALGATGGSVRSLVLRGAMVPVAMGLVVGLVGAWSLSRVMSGMLYEVRPSDPATLLCVTGLLLATGLLASWIPTVRGTRVDPVVTMRGD
jgi:predicted permease